MVKFTKSEWCTLCGIGAVNLATSVCVALQAPFYPEEAESKGATASEYGLVFGIFELVAFVSSPIIGKYMNTLGAKFLLCSGVFLAGSCSVLFGTLDLVDGHDAFIGLSFAVRIVESLGSAAAVTASFSIVAAVFPQSVATTFATLETLYGLGYIVGPTVGGLLFTFGGFQLPFTVMGAVLISVGVLIFFSLPPLEVDETAVQTQAKLCSFLKLTPILLDTLSVTVAAISFGFYQATLEPHLRKFDLTPLTTGFMFIISGGMYAVTAPLVGRLCDTRVYPKKLIVCGCFLQIVSFSLVGPLPYIPIDTTLWMVCLGLFVHGIGHGCILVPAFIDQIRSAVACGLPDDISTYGIVSGLWASAFALGAFIGPSAAGILFDAVGFRKGTLFPIAIHICMLTAMSTFICLERRRPPLLREKTDADADAEKSVLHLNPSWSQDVVTPPSCSAATNGGGKRSYGAFSTQNNHLEQQAVFVSC